ncbi:hypothetical protein [Pseudohongiella sp.]|uniref:Uncharacterized protein n=1 Tax=marine sediment metagenome TaxID=412755 RepID=A0A0F9YVG3_9ZZZZ|nr:hypothetical protein [Pseudohongiella sp.]HDZ08737.1 hypothetical protein [Pseudohongiella sp.]HEA62353.1 hypothetical protein [Pseudohongiella sp.]
MTTQNPKDTTYPISKQFNMHFSPYEDRLVVRAKRVGDSEVHMLLTRRMVMLILQQLLNKLPELTGLEKTPAMYWQEVLQMAHQEAMASKVAADKEIADRQMAAQADNAEERKEVESGASDGADSGPEHVFLATELAVQSGDERLMLAFKGLPMPDAMVKPSQFVPIFAIPLEVENVHQLIELLIDKCQQAQWHLPLELPWIEPPTEDTGNNKKYSLRHH